MNDHDIDTSDDIDTNLSDNPSLGDIIAARLSRRNVLKLGGATTAAFLVSFGSPALAAADSPKGRDDDDDDDDDEHDDDGPLLGFTSVAINGLDEVTVPEGYTASVLYAWGDPVSDGPAFAFDASQDWQAQSVQAGMHHDGIFFFPLNKSENKSKSGLLCINHEYVDQGLLFTDGMVPWTPQKVMKSVAAHGVSVIEVRRRNGEWSVVRPSKYGRRITGATPIKLVGPAAGSALLKTAADPTGTVSLGTINNCGSGKSPWGSYVTCEENFNGYFGWDGAYTPTMQQNRYGITATGFNYRWHEHDPRFNVRLNPNEANRLGWMVEIDPFKPNSMPQKLTAMGRFKHESAAFATTRDGRAVVYSGDDERNNYVYKFVGALPWKKARKMGVSPLAEGTLYVGRFDAGDATGDEMGIGEWIPLNTANPALASMSIDDILVHARVAGDLVGATKMDRPEWITVAPDGRVYVSLTNNSRRGRTTTVPSENPNSVVDDANPRSATGQGNPYGHIVRWSENGDADATTFTWDIFMLAGDPSNPLALDGYKPGGDVVGDFFGSPDGIWADDDGRIWIQTDISTSTLGAGPYINIPNNMMLAADPETKETRRFLIGPKGCEVTGVCTTPDQKTMFVDIQHPGEPASELSDPANPQAISNWPDYRPIGQGRPRAGTLVITKDDGGVIGT
jgi:secreted PhoX family phosphatase